MGTENTKKLPVGLRDKLPAWVYPSWASSGSAVAISTVMIGYATFYCTDVLGLSPAIIGVIMLITRLTDGITDFLIGYLVDNTHTKWGQARPYEIAGVLLWILMMMFYSTPKMGTTAKYVWVFVIYFLITAVCQTIVYGVNNIYLKNAFKKEADRNKVISFSGSIMMFATIIVGILLPQLIARAGTDLSSWSKMGILVGIPCAVMAAMRFLFIPECNAEATHEEKKEKLSLMEGVKTVFRNKYILMLVFIYLMQQFSVAINNSIGTYFFKYYIGDIGLQSIVGFAGFLMPVILIFSPKLLEKFGTRKILLLGTVSGLASIIIRILAGKNIVGHTISAVVSSFYQIPTGALLGIYIFECMDYGAWKTGIRADGMINSLNSVAAKLAMGLTSLMCGFVLGVVNYDGTAAVQPPEVINAIYIMNNIVPLVLSIVALIVALKYDLEKKLPQIRQDLEQRK